MDKKNIKLLSIVVLVVLVVTSWYMLFDTTKKDNDAYYSQLNTARSKAVDGLYEVALEHYASAMQQRDSIELRDEIAQIYKTYADESTYESFCEDIIQDYPLEIVGYERLAALYNEVKAYDSFYNIVDAVKKRNLSSKSIDDMAKESAYEFELESRSMVDVTDFSSGYFPFLSKKGFWGYATSKGNTLLSATYLKVSSFNSAGYAVVQLDEKQIAVIDKTGKKISLWNREIPVEDFSALISDKIAIKYDGKYRYFDSSFNELFGEFDYAGTFFGGVAAVKKGDKWAIINENGNLVTEYIFEDIKLDVKGIAFRNDRGIAKINGKYFLIDSKGTKIVEASWDDADAFNSNMIAAVKKGNSWGFIDAKGTVVVDYIYSGAQSFSNGMAAVSVANEWGFIGIEDYEMKIQPTFDISKDFSTKGTAFVKDGGTWYILRIYSLT